MLMNSNEYIEIIETIKGEIRGAQYKAALSVNRELIMLYYHIGMVINEHKTWGSKFIENLAADIRISFPNVKGYSVRNLKYMAKFAETYPDESFVQQAVHKFLGDILRFCSTNSLMIRYGIGISTKRLKTAGRGMS